MIFFKQMFFTIRLVSTITFVSLLAACGGGGSDGGGTPTPAANLAPTANAGADQEVNSQVSVTLSGSGADTDGSITSYIWTQTSGTSVTINNASSATASFTSPTLTSSESLTFKLTITDNEAASQSDSVSIIVNPDIIDTNSYVKWQYDAQSCASGSWVDCEIDFSSAIQIDDFEDWVIAFRTGGSKDDDHNDGFTIGDIGNSQALIATQSDTRDPGDSRRTEAKVAYIPVGDYKVSFNLYIETVPDFDTTISQIKCGSGKPPINIKLTAGGGVRVKSGGNTPLSDTPGYFNEGWHTIEYTIENSKTLLSLTIDGNIVNIDNSLTVTDCSLIDDAGPDYYLKIGLYESDVPPGYRIGYQNLTLKQL